MNWHLDMLTSFMPHALCFQAKPHILILYILGHGGTALAYLFGFRAAVVATLEAHGVTLNHASAVKLKRFVWWCGLGHLGTVLTLWWGYYALVGVVAIVTAFVSWDFVLSVREKTDTDGAA